MKNVFQTRILAVVLAAVTVAVCVLAGLNLSSETNYNVPTDGIWWTEAAGGLCAQQVPAGAPGQRAGIRSGDVLEAVDEHATPTLAAQVRQMFHDGIWAHATYSVVRPAVRCDIASHSTKLEIPVILEPTDRTINLGLRLIALVYLAIGLYVLFRRWTAPKSTHFYVFCLVSFVLYAFKYTGEFDALRPGHLLVQRRGDGAAAGAVPALRDQLYGSTPERDERRRRSLLCPLLYLPGPGAGRLAGDGDRALVGDRDAEAPAGPDRTTRTWRSTTCWRRWCSWFALRSERAPAGAAAAEVADARNAAGGGSLHRAVRRFPSCSTATCRRSLTQAGAAVADPAAADVQLGDRALPADGRGPDLQARRDLHAGDGGAGGAVLRRGRADARRWCIRVCPASGVWGLVAAIIVTALVFDPLKRADPGRVDRVFDQKSFDYRETLIDFGRELNAQTDLRALVDSIVERLPQTLLVTRVAVFLAAG